jgi:hypothetical protein
MSLLSVVALLAGCTPQDADVQAKYAIYLAAASSENINRLDSTGVPVEDRQEKLGLTPVDCRDLTYLADEADDDAEAAELIAAARLTGADYAAECCSNADATDDFDCNPVQPAWFDWMNDYAYFLKEGDVEPWRTEAVITTEGDFQLTVHMDFPDFGDLRFGWVIDPTFQPKECVDGTDGAELQDVDGSWLDGWSQGEEGTLWQLNAGAYQVNPSDNAKAWYFQPSWDAGYTFARFGDEEFYGHATDYQDSLYRPFYAKTYYGDCADGGDNDNDGDVDGDDKECHTGLDFEGPQIPASHGTSADQYADWVAETRTYFNGDDTEKAIADLSVMGKSTFPLQMKIEDNGWRGETTDEDPSAGFQGWLGVSSSWVRIDNPEDIAVHPDKPITGEFQIYLEGLAAASKMFIGGTFSINNVREDVWGFNQGTLDEVKREENDTPECGEERLTTDTPSSGAE